MIVVGSQGSGIRGGQVVSSQELVVSELLKKFLTPANLRFAEVREKMPSPNPYLLAPIYLHGGV